MNYQELGRKIQEAREEMRISQEQLASLIGCSQAALSNYEKGKRRIYLSQLEQVAAVLNKPLDYFVDALGSSQARPVRPSHRQDQRFVSIIEDIYRFSDRELSEIEEFIRYIKWKRGT